MEGAVSDRPDRPGIPLRFPTLPRAKVRDPRRWFQRGEVTPEVAKQWDELIEQFVKGIYARTDS
jgi:hypothetical protein